ncbi:MAG: glycogen/starch synthase [Desulfobacterales bacterium]
MIHCHDWMTGLIPAIARDFGIPCIFTFQSHETAKSTLSDVEDMGIDAAAFWQNLYFDRFPFNYEETRKTNPIDFLLSGIFAVHCVNVADHAFFAEIGKVQNSYCKLLRQIIADKLRSGSAVDLSNSPVDTQQYLDLYGKMLQRPLIETKKDDYKSFTDDRHGSKNISEAFPKKQGISDSFNPVMVAG